MSKWLCESARIKSQNWASKIGARDWGQVNKLGKRHQRDAKEIWGKSVSAKEFLWVGKVKNGVKIERRKRKGLKENRTISRRIRFKNKMWVYRERLGNGRSKTRSGRAWTAL